MLPRHPIPRRIALTLLWITAAGWFCYAAWRLFGVELTWPFAAAMAFAPYVTLATVVPLGLALWLRSLPATTVVVVSLCALLTVMIPRVFSGSSQHADGPDLRVLTVNLMRGQADADEVVSLVRDNHIDVLSVQELTRDSVDALAGAGLDEVLSHHELKPDAAAAGTGIYSRHPLTPHPRLTTEGLFWMPAVSIDVPESEVPVEFVAAHPSPPLGSQAFGHWRRDLSALPDAPRSDRPRVLAGDFNASLDHAALRELVGTGYVDAGEATGEGMRGTWPTDKMVPKVAIDHILVNALTSVDSYAVHDIEGSDHRAVSARLRLSQPDG